jgi:hypothetical protein
VLPALHDDDDTSAAVERAATQFRLGISAFDEIMSGIAALDSSERSRAVWNAAREAARGGLELLAQRIVTSATLDDLVLPPAQLAALHDITRHLRHRDRVYRAWGFGDKHKRGQGITALFVGESGTGKTLAAEAIANEVELDLFRVDLATVVSKYIGETEKNLKRVFDAAEASGAVLLFDEADALFGKRGGQRQPRSVRQHRNRVPAPARRIVPRPRHSDDEHEVGHRSRVSAADSVRGPLSVSRCGCARADLAQAVSCAGANR